MSRGDLVSKHACQVTVVCPNPRHEFIVRVDPSQGDDLAEQACEHVFALLNIGRGGVDDLAELGYPPEQVHAVRAWYAHHRDLCPRVTLEVVTAEGTVRRLGCDDTGRARASDTLCRPLTPSTRHQPSSLLARAATTSGSFVCPSPPIRSSRPATKETSSARP